MFSRRHSQGNLVARIPGLDRSRAAILGAHIDSPNSPGALDDGSRFGHPAGDGPSAG
jgi:hypothetical protein